MRPAEDDHVAAVADLHDGVRLRPNVEPGDLQAVDVRLAVPAAGSAIRARRIRPPRMLTSLSVRPSASRRAAPIVSR